MEIYKKLIDSYSNKNLNRIARNLIQLYKSNNFEKIKEIANRISKYVDVSDTKDAKIFANLMMLYHPDKGEQHKNSIRKLYSENNKQLENFSHIFTTQSILSEKILETVSTITNDSDLDIEFKEEYSWDTEQEYGFEYSTFDEDQNYENNFVSENYEKSFYNEIKIREYGQTNIEFPTYYLEDFEEFELTDCGMKTLDGVQYCVHVKVLDVSYNSISDISDLANLNNIEEVYLANNEIGYIDSLCNLLNLRIIDLSNNKIDDISPLMELLNLESVNLIGNKIPKEQIAKLKKKCTLVLTDYL